MQAREFTAPGRPNVVVVTIDTLRADHTSPYGYHLPTTPVLQRLASDGVVFDKAYAPMPTTGPSHASLFTSQYPLAHGMLRNGQILSEDVTTFAETLRERGYSTAAFVSSFVLSRDFGFAQGFDAYDDDFSDADSSYRRMTVWEGVEVDGNFDRRASETTNAVVDWLTHRDDGRPFFLWVHYFDPHHPYDPPDRWRSKYVADEQLRDLAWAHALYDAEVEFTDRELGSLLSTLSRVSPPEETLLVVTADHGEGLNDHGYMGHGPILYEETVRVPLVIRWEDRIPGGTRVAEAVELIDLLPTVLGLLHMEPEPQTLLQGRDLSRHLLAGEPLRSDEPVYVQRRLYGSDRVGSFAVEGIRFDDPMSVAGPKFAVRRGPWKYIEAPAEGTYELYDLARDPAERVDLFHQRQQVAHELATLLDDWRRRQSEVALGPARDASPEELEKLRSMGYLE